MLRLLAKGAVVCFLFISFFAVSQTPTVALVIDALEVNAMSFTITGPGVNSVYSSGPGGRFTINPQVVAGGGSIHILTPSAPGIQQTEILFDYSETGIVSNVRIVLDEAPQPLNNSLYSVTGNEITFLKRPTKNLQGLNLHTNLINGTHFDRSTTPFFIISGAEAFAAHELRIYQLGETGNEDYAVFAEYILPNNPATNNRIIYQSTTEFRWNGCESVPGESQSFRHVPAGTYLFELDLRDDTGTTRTFYGQMFVSGLHPRN